MRKLTVLVIFFLVAACLLCFCPVVVTAHYYLPHRFVGTAKVDGVWVPEGTEISAWVNGIKYAETTTLSLPNQQSWQFILDVPVDDVRTPDDVEGAMDGEIVVFKIKRIADWDYMVAHETAVFYFNGYTLVSLTTEVPPPATLEGQVHLQGRPAPPNSRWETPLRVTFLPVVTTEDVITDDEGRFTIDNIVPDTYNIRVKNSHTLSRLVTGVVFYAGATVVVDFGTLPEGDGNDDNVVDIDDVTLLATSFGKSSGQPGFIDNCDFTRDGVVDIDDVTLIALNFGTFGP